MAMQREKLIKLSVFLWNTIVLVTAFFLLFFAGIGSADDFPEYDGVIEPYEVVEVGSSLEGIVDQVRAERSQMVRKGEPLVFLESSVEQASLARAVVDAEIMGEIMLEKEKLDFAQRSFERIEALYQNKSVSQQQHDEYATEVKLATYRLLKANDRKQLAEMELKRAKAILDLRTIRSPVTGVVVERYVSPGEFVNDLPLLKIARMDPLRVEIIVPSAQFGKIVAGMQAQVKPEFDDAKVYTATVSIVDKVIDAASNTFGVRLELPNPDSELPGGLRCSVQLLPPAEENMEAAQPGQISEAEADQQQKAAAKTDKSLSQTIIDKTKKDFRAQYKKSQDKAAHYAYEQKQPAKK